MNCIGNELFSEAEQRKCLRMDCIFNLDMHAFADFCESFVPSYKVKREKWQMDLFNKKMGSFVKCESCQCLLSKDQVFKNKACKHKICMTCMMKMNKNIPKQIEDNPLSSFKICAVPRCKYYPKKEEKQPKMEDPEDEFRCNVCQSALDFDTCY